MTTQITEPEVEALVNQRLQTGDFKDAEDVVLHALQDSTPGTTRSAQEPVLAKDMVELFALCAA